MTPCYQICKDRKCPYWNPELLNCDKLPDDCDYAVEHLVSDCENQVLDGKRHGRRRGFHINGALAWEDFYILGERCGVSRNWYDNGVLWNEEVWGSDSQ